jgi:hypothetical protein
MAIFILKILLTLFAIQALVKFAFFFLLSYEQRRKQLDKAYGNKVSATSVTDNILLAIVLVLIVLVFVSGSMEYISFTAGLYIGATLIQLYFHRFSKPLPPEEAPGAPVSPIKMMSYAIQANPEKPWKELVILGALFLWALIMLVARGFELL